MSLFVGNISHGAGPEDVRSMFLAFGECRVDVKRGYAFVDYVDERDAEDALKRLHGKDVRGMRLNVEWSKRHVARGAGLVPKCTYDSERAPVAKYYDSAYDADPPASSDYSRRERGEHSRDPERGGWDRYRDADRNRDVDRGGRGGYSADRGTDRGRYGADRGGYGADRGGYESRDRSGYGGDRGGYARDRGSDRSAYGDRGAYRGDRGAYGGDRGYGADRASDRGAHGSDRGGGYGRRVSDRASDRYRDSERGNYRGDRDREADRDRYRSDRYAESQRPYDARASSGSVIGKRTERVDDYEREPTPDVEKPRPKRRKNNKIAANHGPSEFAVLDDVHLKEDEDGIASLMYRDMDGEQWDEPAEEDKLVDATKELEVSGADVAAEDTAREAGESVVTAADAGRTEGDSHMEVEKHDEAEYMRKDDTAGANELPDVTAEATMDSAVDTSMGAAPVGAVPGESAYAAEDAAADTAMGCAQQTTGPHAGLEHDQTEAQPEDAGDTNGNGISSDMGTEVTASKDESTTNVAPGTEQPLSNGARDPSIAGNNDAEEIPKTPRSQEFNKLTVPQIKDILKERELWDENAMKRYKKQQLIDILKEAPEV